MADDTTDTPPGTAPDELRTGSDGSVPDLGGRRAWVWMQDTEEGGGGRFDVRSDRVEMWRRKGARVVPSYPINFRPAGRIPKPAANRRAADPPERTAVAGEPLPEVPGTAYPADAEPLPVAVEEQPLPGDAGDSGEPQAAPPAAVEEQPSPAGPGDGPTTTSKSSRRGGQHR